MAMTITTPGIYEMPKERYHENCCDSPSLSSSGGRKIMSTCPAEFWHESSLNPDRVEEQKTDFDIGNAGHIITLEPSRWGERVVLIDADNYKTKAAQDARDRAYNDGKIPLLPKHEKIVLDMHKALMAHPLGRQAFVDGDPEKSFFWKHETGIWCKARPDWFPRNPVFNVDFKTTGSADPQECRKRIWDNGLFMQAPWYDDGVQALTGKRPEAFWFVFQSTKPPHLVTVIKLDYRAYRWGQILNEKARRIFAECLQKNEWPGYRRPDAPDKDTAFELPLPVWAEYQLEDRALAGEFESASNGEMATWGRRPQLANV